MFEKKVSVSEKKVSAPIPIPKLGLCSAHYYLPLGFSDLPRDPYAVVRAKNTQEELKK